MNNKSLREMRRNQRQRKKLISTTLWIGLAIIVVAVLGTLLWSKNSPSTGEGESVPILADAGDHVPEGTDPGPFNSDPPTSGRHYGQEYDAGFYDDDAPEAQVPYPEGYLGHNLEHGYVIYWYNCNLLTTSECNTLKNQIKASLSDNGETKLIAFPRPTLDVPVALTSWGKLLRMDEFNPDQAKAFVDANRFHAPEPNAP